MIEEAAKRSGGATKRIGEATQGIHDTAKGFGQMTEEVDHTTNKVDENIRAFIVSQSLKVAPRSLGAETVARKLQTWSCLESLKL